LLSAFPQFVNMNSEEIAYYVNQCLKNSIRVNDFFLSREINTKMPSTRFSPNEDYYYDTPNSLMGHIYNWMFNSDYVEVFIIFYEDGTASVYRDPTNTTTSATGPPIQIRDQGSASESYYYNNKRVSGFGHTHSQSNSPSSADYQTKNKFSKINHYIYYGGSFHSY